MLSKQLLHRMLPTTHVKQKSISRKYDITVVIPQIQPKRSLRAFSVLGHPSHFLLADVRHCLGLKRHHYPTIPRGPLLTKSILFLVY